MIKDINECMTSPCKAEGTCIDKLNGSACICPAGYSGPTCEISKNRN